MSIHLNSSCGFNSNLSSIPENQFIQPSSSKIVIVDETNSSKDSPQKDLQSSLNFPKIDEIGVKGKSISAPLIKSLSKSEKKFFKKLSPSQNKGKQEIPLTSPKINSKNQTSNIFTEFQQNLLNKCSHLEQDLQKNQLLLKQITKYIKRNEMEEAQIAFAKLKNMLSSELSIVKDTSKEINFNISPHTDNKSDIIIFNFLDKFPKINKLLNKLTLLNSTIISDPEQLSSSENQKIAEKILGKKIVENILGPERKNLLKSSDSLKNQKLTDSKEENIDKEIMFEKELNRYGKAIQLLNSIHEALNDFCQALKNPSIKWNEIEKGVSAFEINWQEHLPKTKYCRTIAIQIAENLLPTKEKKKGASIEITTVDIGKSFQRYLDFLDSSIQKLITTQAQLLVDKQKYTNRPSSYQYSHYCQTLQDGLLCNNSSFFHSEISNDYKRVLKGGTLSFWNGNGNCLLENFLDFQNSINNILQYIVLHDRLPETLPKEYNQWISYATYVNNIYKKKDLGLKLKENSNFVKEIEQEVINLYFECCLECLGDQLFGDQALFGALTKEVYEFGQSNLNEQEPLKKIKKQEHLSEFEQKNNLHVHAKVFENLVSLLNKTEKNNNQKASLEERFGDILKGLNKKGYQGITNSTDLQKAIFYLILFYSTPSQELLLIEPKVISHLYHLAFNKSSEISRSLDWSDQNTKSIKIIFHDNRLSIQLMRRSPLIRDWKDCFFITRKEIDIPLFSLSSKEKKEEEISQSLTPQIFTKFFYEIPGSKMTSQDQFILDEVIRELHLVLTGAGFPTAQKVEHNLPNTK